MEYECFMDRFVVSNQTMNNFSSSFHVVDNNLHLAMVLASCGIKYDISDRYMVKGIF